MDHVYNNCYDGVPIISVWRVNQWEVTMNSPILKLDKSVFKRSLCPLTNVLDVFGDKWTILIVRDIMLGKERYQEFLSSPEKISTNILAERLKRLLYADIIVRRAYRYKPVRYEYILTSRGEGLKSVLQVLATWGLKNFPGTEVFPSKLGTESRHFRKH